MYDADMFYWTNVHPKKAPNFFELLEKGDSAWTEPDTTDVDEGGEVEKKIEDSGPVSDEILGVWTWTGEEYKDPGSGRKVRRKLVVDVRRASTERSTSGSEEQREYFYEGYVVAIENLTEMNRPLASPGQLCWKISYTGPSRPVSSDVLGYILDSTIDRMGAFKIRLLRKENVLEVGLVKYYR